MVYHNRDARLPLSPRRVLQRRRNRLSPCADPGKPPHLLALLRLTPHPKRTTAEPPRSNPGSPAVGMRQRLFSQTIPSAGVASLWGVTGCMKCASLSTHIYVEIDSRIEDSAPLSSSAWKVGVRGERPGTHERRRPRAASDPVPRSERATRARRHRRRCRWRARRRRARRGAGPRAARRCR
jgi:hypothetical protein